MHRNEVEDVVAEVERFVREKGPGDNLVLALSNGDRIRVRWELNPNVADLGVPAAVLNAECESGVARIARECVERVSLPPRLVAPKPVFLTRKLILESMTEFLRPARPLDPAEGPTVCAAAEKAELSGAEYEAWRKRYF
jgi:hypothetical protein